MLAQGKVLHELQHYTINKKFMNYIMLVLLTNLLLRFLRTDDLTTVIFLLEWMKILISKWTWNQIKTYWFPVASKIQGCRKGNIRDNRLLEGSLKYLKTEKNIPTVAFICTAHRIIIGQLGCNERAVTLFTFNNSIGICDVEYIAYT